MKAGAVYLAGKDRIVALDAQTGKPLWTCGFPEEARGRTPVVFEETVAVALQNGVLLVDRGTGAAHAHVKIDGPILGLDGPPLVVLSVGKDAIEARRIDPSTGEVAAIQRVGPRVALGDIAVERDNVLVQMDHPSGKWDDPDVLVGLMPPDLKERWRRTLSLFSRFERLRGKVYVVQFTDGPDDSFSTLDPLTGEIESVLPPRDPSEERRTSLRQEFGWEFEIIGHDEAETTRIRRNDPATGKPSWTISVPGYASPRSGTADRDTLYVVSDSGGTQRYLSIVDVPSGTVRHVLYGLPGLVDLSVSGDLLIAHAGWGILALSLREFGPPMEATHPIEGEVERILGGLPESYESLPRGDRSLVAVSRDLIALGDDALPLIAGRIPSLPVPALVSAALVVKEKGYRPAAPGLAKRLAGPLPDVESDWYSDDNPLMALLHALAATGGAAEVEAVSAVLSDRTRRGVVRRQALATLGGIGTPEAIARVEASLSEIAPPAGPWWSPPDPGEYLKCAGVPFSEEAFQEARDRNDQEAMARMTCALLSGRVRPGEGGGEFVIFPHRRLGGRFDLWMSEIDPNGAVKPAVFLGLTTLRGGTREVNNSIQSMKLDGRTLEIVPFGQGAKPYRVDLAKTGVDRDHDGLPDVVERRIRTNPGKVDTDGDGFKDGQDPAPNATRRLPRTVEEAISLAIFRQFFAFEDRDDCDRDLVVMVGDSSLEWRGRSGPTITLSEKEDQRFRDEAGEDGVRHIRIEPVKEVEREYREGAKHPDGRVWRLHSHVGGENAATYRVVVRQLGGRWYITELALVSVS